jgi:hypothetical protein
MARNATAAVRLGLTYDDVQTAERRDSLGDAALDVGDYTAVALDDCRFDRVLRS